MDDSPNINSNESLPVPGRQLPLVAFFQNAATWLMIYLFVGMLLVNLPDKHTSIIDGKATVIVDSIFAWCATWLFTKYQRIKRQIPYYNADIRRWGFNYGVAFFFPFWCVYYDQWTLLLFGNGIPVLFGLYVQGYSHIPWPFWLLPYSGSMIALTGMRSAWGTTSRKQEIGHFEMLHLELCKWACLCTCLLSAAVLWFLHIGKL
jgi:hypothetical protein